MNKSPVIVAIILIKYASIKILNAFLRKDFSKCISASFS
jgi:hypothetical protein